MPPRHPSSEEPRRPVSSSTATADKTYKREPSPSDERRRPRSRASHADYAAGRHHASSLSPRSSSAHHSSRLARHHDNDHDDYDDYDHTHHRRHSAHYHSGTSSSALADREEKPWFKKKTLWTSVASLATVVALVPTTLSAHASVDAANAAGRAARSSKKAASATHKSAEASVASARAVENTAIANGHQDFRGRYTGPVRAGGERGPIPVMNGGSGSVAATAGQGRHGRALGW